MQQKRLIRCYKCSRNSYLFNLEKVILKQIREMSMKVRIVPQQRKVLSTTLKQCEKCMQANAQYECLTCNFLLCAHCNENHAKV